jgi:hypothetical protein
MRPGNSTCTGLPHGGAVLGALCVNPTADPLPGLDDPDMVAGALKLECRYQATHTGTDDNDRLGVGRQG